jgi:hypothetical protein
MKMIGKPYSGKLNVRFDEGEPEIEPWATTPAPYSTLVGDKSLLSLNTAFVFGYFGTL